MTRILWICFLMTVHGAMVAQTPQHRLHVAILGDSNTWLGGDDCDQPRGWNTWFRKKFSPLSCKSYARSGATWTNTPATTVNTAEYTEVLSNDNVIFNQINRLKAAYIEGRQPAPDLILIAAGTNDAWFTKARPQVFSLGADQAFASCDSFTTRRPANSILSLAESVRYGCELLMEQFPDAQIILLTPMQSKAVSPANISKAGDIIEACARRMGLCVIRQDHTSSVYRAREASGSRYTYDGTHTTEAGARRNGYFIANQVSTMLQY